MAKREKVTLVMQDAANRSKLTFGSWEEAHNHIRMVILYQIVDELAELALQDDPSQFKRTVEDLREIAGDINHPKKRGLAEGCRRRLERLHGSRDRIHNHRNPVSLWRRSA